MFDFTFTEACHLFILNLRTLGKKTQMEIFIRAFDFILKSLI